MMYISDEAFDSDHSRIPNDSTMPVSTSCEPRGTLVTDRTNLKKRKRDMEKPENEDGSV